MNSGGFARRDYYLRTWLRYPHLHIHSNINGTLVKCHTTALNGKAFILEVKKEWAPLGAERFLALVESGFFTDVSALPLSREPGCIVLTALLLPTVRILPSRDELPDAIRHHPRPEPSEALEGAGLHQG